MTKPAQKDLFAYAHDNRASLVYVITNRKNGKRYVGVTRLSLHKRAQKHIWNALKTNIAGKLYTAIRSHGPNVFAFNIFTTCESYKDALAEERRLIAEVDPEYNLTKGGEGIVGHRFTDDSRAKMSISAKKRGAPWAKGECPPEIRERISQAKKGRPRRQSDLSRSALRKAHAIGCEARNRAVVCLKTGAAFRNAKAAADALGVSRTSITNYCDGKYKRGTFAYVEEMYAI